MTTKSNERLIDEVAAYKAEIERLNKKIAELEQDLIHADENVFYREMEVRLDKDKIKAQAIKDFTHKLIKVIEDTFAEFFKEPKQ